MNKTKKVPLITFDLPQRWIIYELENVHCKASEARYMLVEVLIVYFKGVIPMMFIKVTFGPPYAQALYKLYYL